jgi:hypothetical protein
MWEGAITLNPVPLPRGGRFWGPSPLPPLPVWASGSCLLCFYNIWSPPLLHPFFPGSIFELCLLYKIDAAGCFQQRPIIYVMSSFPFSPNFPHWLFIYSLCATVCLYDVCFKYLLLNNYLVTLLLYLFFPSSATTAFETPFLYKYTHFQDITPRFFSFFRITIQFVT